MAILKSAAGVLLVVGLVLALAGAGIRIAIGDKKVSTRPSRGTSYLMIVLGVPFLAVGATLVVRDHRTPAGSAHAHPSASATPFYQPKADRSPIASPSLSPTPSPSPSPVPSPDVTITSPAAGTEISGDDGVNLVGTATDIGAETLWVLDPDPDNGDIYRDNDSAISVIGDSWSYRDRPIGDAGKDDVGSRYVIRVVLADTSCAYALVHRKPDGTGEVRFSTLPPGCTVAASVTVVKVRP